LETSFMEICTWLGRKEWEEELTGGGEEEGDEEV
jgi:hypothetical protein